MHKFTTGQMIDNLGIDDTATNQDGYKAGYDHKGNLLMWVSGEDKPIVKEGNNFFVYMPWVKNDIWEINYHFVSFEEAQAVHKTEKKTVVYVHNEKMRYRFVFGEHGHFQQLGYDGIELNELIKGNWIIEN